MTPAARGVLALLISLVLVGGYTLSYTFAQATPAPHGLPVAVVTAGDGAAWADRIEREHRDAYEVHRVAARAAATAQIGHRDVYAALVATPGGPHLLLAPAAGKTTAEQLALRLPAAAGLPKPPQTEMVRPLAKRDPNGTALDYVVFPVLIFGIVMPLLLTTVAPVIPLRRRLALVAGYALAGGTTVVLIANVALDALPGPLGSELLVAALALLAVATTTTALIGLLGPPGVVLAILVLLILGNASSGTLVAWELLPGLHRAVGPWLPPGCLAQALRNLAYFGGVDLLRPVLALAGYAMVAAATTLALGDRRPAPQGDPAGPTTDLSS